MRSFRSDNNAGLTPEAMAAFMAANDASHHTAYGDDAMTADAAAAFQQVFGGETAVFFVATGTAANTLAVASLTEPWEQVICHEHSHYNDDESTAPERITHCRITPIHAAGSKLTPDDLRRATDRSRGDLHQPQPGVVTISNSTEFGEVYMPDEVRGLAAAAHELGYRVHVDGARFANAVASVGCSAAELAGDAGVDALSFGGTKNGLAFGEAVLFFRQGDGRVYERAVATFPFHRKGTGHLLSKHRFIAAPFGASLRDGSWLRHAAHANAMARKLDAGLRALEMDLPFSTQANGVFVRWPQRVHAHLTAKGYGYYPFGPTSQGIYRLMCSFDTQAEDVEALLAEVGSVM